ncbi:MAG: MBL fold metallo-hydrolase, partial [Gaiellales bacterium]
INTHVREHGLPEDAIEQLAPELQVVRRMVQLPPETAWQPLDEGDRLELGGRQWRVRLTPGHADGHLVLHDERGSVLLAGDHLLEHISPAVGRFPKHERDPLARYLESLMIIGMLDPQTVLPGHGEPFSGAATRARALVAHHEQRIEACVEALRTLGRATAYDVARVVFARVFERTERDVANHRFATTESLAHLERARFAGRLTRSRDEDSFIRYQHADG